MAPPRQAPVRAQAARLLSGASAVLALGAAAALGVGWFWAQSRGDWQAVALWAYWLCTPVLSGVALVASRRDGALRRINVCLLGLWAAISLFVLALPSWAELGGHG